MTAADRWDGDVNEAVVEEWVAETTPFERVQEVLLATTTFQYAKRFADQARVSEPSARKHLNALADSGLADTDDTGQGTRYKRSRVTVALGRVKELHTECTRDELIDGIQDLKEKIEAYREEYSVTNPKELALSLEAGDSDGWTAVSRWQGLEENLQVAQAALALYSFEPDDEHGGTTAQGMGSNRSVVDKMDDIRA